MLNADPAQNEQVTVAPLSTAGARIRIPEIAKRLDIGRLVVYDLLDQGLIPGIRLGGGKGKRWIVTRHAYMEWERTAGRRVA